MLGVFFIIFSREQLEQTGNRSYFTVLTQADSPHPVSGISKYVLHPGAASFAAVPGSSAGAKLHFLEKRRVPRSLPSDKESSIENRTRSDVDSPLESFWGHPLFDWNTNPRIRGKALATRPRTSGQPYPPRSAHGRSTLLPASRIRCNGTLRNPIPQRFHRQSGRTCP